MTLDDAAKAMREAMRENVSRHWLWYLVQGSVMVVGGVLALIYPVLSSFAVVLLIGWVFIIAGLSQGVSLIGATQVPHFWIQLVSVVLSILIGWLFLLNPQAGLTTLALLFVVFLMMEGVSKVVFALTIRPFPQWHWVLASGVLGCVLSIVLLAIMPISAFWVLGVMLGLQLIGEGAAIGYLGWRARPPSPSPSPGGMSARPS
jgi:uncharacterized membrane protein HdeD (DUF308 family)